MNSLKKSLSPTHTAGQTLRAEHVTHFYQTQDTLKRLRVGVILWDTLLLSVGVGLLLQFIALS